MDIDDKIDFSNPLWGGQQLAAVSIFANFTQAERERLYRLGRIVKVEAHANAVIEGEDSRGLYLLLSGAVSVYKSNFDTGSLTRLAILEQGSSFGEMSLFDNAPRSATITAESLCYLFKLDSEAFDQFLETEGPDLKIRFYKKCAEDLAIRFRSQNTDYVASQLLLWKHALRKEEASKP